MADTVRLALVWSLRLVAAWAVLLLASDIASLAQLLWASREVGAQQQWQLGFVQGASLYVAIMLTCLTVSEIALTKKRKKISLGRKQ